jgi:hypothetical protein
VSPTSADEPEVVFSLSFESRTVPHPFHSIRYMIHVSETLSDLWRGKRTKPYRIKAHVYKFLYDCPPNQKLLDYLERRGLLIVPEVV